MAIIRMITLSETLDALMSACAQAPTVQDSSPPAGAAAPAGTTDRMVMQSMTQTMLDRIPAQAPAAK